MLERHRLAQRLTHHFSHPEKPGSPPDVTLGPGDAGQTIQALRGASLVAQLSGYREAFPVESPGPVVVPLQQRRPSQVVQGEIEASLVPVLPADRDGLLVQCRPLS
jgi:hypothetical protein